MSKRILIVGGVAGGASAATRARRVNESAEIVVFERGEHVSFASCGVPYYVSGEIEDFNKLLVATPASFQQSFAIDVRIRHELLAIDRAQHRIEILNHNNGQRTWEPYDKLILSPGASSIVPPWPNRDKANVFSLIDFTGRLMSFIEQEKPRRAVVVGAGYIGLELVEALVRRGIHVTVIEAQPQVMPPLDRDMAAEAEKTLTRNGVALHLGTKVQELVAEGERVTAVTLEDGQNIATDMVLVVIGMSPNVALARDAGLQIGLTGAITVNQYMQSSDPDIYAVGDAAEVEHAVLGRPARVPLAGPANRNGRLAGEHAATGSSAAATRVPGTSIVGLFNTAAAMTGLSLKAARAAGLNAGAAYAIRPHHASYYPGAEPMVLKLVFDRSNRRVLGAQAVGGKGVDKRIDVVSTVLHFKGTVDDLAGVDLTYAPQFGAAKDPIHIAAFVAQNELAGLLKQSLPGEPIPTGQLIDVRTAAEFAGGTLPGAVNIPLQQLRRELAKLKRDEPVVVFCQVGQRGYNAARILSQSGFQDVTNLAGGYRLHAKL